MKKQLNRDRHYTNFPLIFKTDKAGFLVFVLHNSYTEQKELLEIVEERYGRKATIITSQLPVKDWHAAMQDPTLANAILDRLVHNAYKIKLEGDSMRRKRAILVDRKTESMTK